MTLQFSLSTIQKTFNRVAEFPAADFLTVEINHRLLEQLEFMRFKPEVIIDLGCGKGYASKVLKNKYPLAEIYSLDLADKIIPKQQNGICANASQLPLRAQSVDLVYSNLMLPWCENMEAIFAEVQRILKPGGLFLFTTFGPETLQELAQAWHDLDNFPHQHLFYDLQDIGDVLLQQQFLDPVIDREMLVVNYQNCEQLCKELKFSGMNNIHKDRRNTLTGKKRWQKFANNINAQANQNGKIPIRFEIIYGHAWRSNVLKNSNGEFAISVDSILKNR